MARFCVVVKAKDVLVINDVLNEKEAEDLALESMKNRRVNFWEVTLIEKLEE
jgi:hypoxanthine-guanine phosphoribosyltransferase